MNAASGQLFTETVDLAMETRWPAAEKAYAKKEDTRHEFLDWKADKLVWLDEDDRDRRYQNLKDKVVAEVQGMINKFVRDYDESHPFPLQLEEGEAKLRAKITDCIRAQNGFAALQAMHLSSRERRSRGSARSAYPAR